MIASFIPSSSKLGDIGTDHAYLPVYLIQAGIISTAIGVDIHVGPCEAALDTVQAYGLKEFISIRLGDGLIPLEKGEVDTLVIAGMGGSTTLGILESNPLIIPEIQTLILQPQGAESRVRRELLTQGWKLKDECLIEEDKRVYTVLCFSRSEGLAEKEIILRTQLLCQSIWKRILDDGILEQEEKGYHDDINRMIWQFGPLIIEKRDRLLEVLLQDNKKNLKKIAQEMKRTDREEVKIRAKQINQQIKVMEVMERWLFQ